MSQFVTISKSDEQFWPMLTGRFSKTHFAQPVQNLYVNSMDETITFKIIQKESLSLIGALSQWYSLTRNIYLIFPVLGGISYLTASYGLASLELIVASLLALQFFLMSLVLYNDYSDYVNGVDRVNEHNTKKPLIQGLIRPFQARQLALAFLALAFLFASYCFVQKPATLIFALIALGLGAAVTSRRISQKAKGLSLIITFLLAGPLLVLGYEYLLYSQMTVASACLGFVFGLHALKYDFSKQVRDIFYNSKANVSTLSTLIGFERSKGFYTALSLAHIVALSLFAIESGRHGVFLVVVVAVCFEVYINSLFYGAASFLSSNLSYCLSLQKLHYTMECSLLVFLFLSPQWLSLL